MKKSVLFLAIFTIVSLLAINQAFATSYTWSLSSEDWSHAAAWGGSGPPTSADIAIFDGNTCSLLGVSALTVKIDATPQTVSQLQLISNCTVYLVGIAASNLTCGGGANALQVGTNSLLIFGGNQAVTVTVPTGSTGVVNGAVRFSQTVTAAHRLLAADSAGITFNSGASFQMAPAQVSGGGAGNAFGTVNLNSIVFKSGATYYHGGTETGPIATPSQAGSNPFGAAAPNSVIIFESGSNCVWWSSTGFSTGSRTFGNFIWRGTSAGSASAAATPTTMIVLNNFQCMTSNAATVGLLTMTAATAVDPTVPGIIIGGDLIVDAGSGGLNDGAAAACPFVIKGNVSINRTITLAASATRVYTLAGTSNQNVNTFGATLSSLSVNNSAGITLASNVSIVNTLCGIAGNINTGSNYLSVGTSGFAGNINMTGISHIVGNLIRGIPAATGTIDLPISTATNDVGPSVIFTVAPTAGVLTASFTASTPGNTGLPLSEDSVTLDKAFAEGFWTISGPVGGTYTLKLQANGFNFTGGPMANFRTVKRTDGGSSWTLDGSPGTNSSQTVVRNGLSGFSDFGIAGPFSEVPVELSIFSTE